MILVRMNWKSNFAKGKELVLSTSSRKGIPNANVVLSLGIIDNKLLVANCQMNTTLKNLKENNNICVIGGYFRIKGTVEIFSSDKYFDLCIKNNKEYSVSNAILITVNEVFDLNKCSLVNIRSN